jgi:hypothetical protein
MKTMTTVCSMKALAVNLSIVAGVATLLCGCGESKPAAPVTEEKPAPATNPAPTAQTAPAAPAPAPAAPAPAAPTEPAAPPPAPVAAAPAAVPDATAQFVTAANSQPDKQLGSIGTELADKVKALSESASGNDAVQSQLTNSVQALVAGNDAGALSTLYQTAKGASLTPEQTQLAKDVGNVASAYVVQKNFASLDGAQGDVATIVNSLRKGQITPAVPALQRVGQNANLTPTQKQLVASLADRYAPGTTKAAGTLQQGLKSLENLGGTSK